MSLTMSQGWNPRTGELVGDPVPDTTADELDRVLAAASRAAVAAREADLRIRARWLRAVAARIEAARDELVALADAETGLPQGRLIGEVARTTGQFELFARVVEDGSLFEATIDHADPAATPPFPDLRRLLEPLGPVLVFAASNFPFAFGVAGTDTASALAAGCAVVVKAHPGHPRLSTRLGELLTEALAGAGAPDGIVGVIHGLQTGVAAIADLRIRAASFTGSLAAGRALHELAAGRTDPIPFYGELGSLNPVVVTPAAVRARGAVIVAGYVESFTLGTGQYCTKPGILLVPAGHGLEAELSAAADAVAATPMLNERLLQGYLSGVDVLARQPSLRPLRAPSLVDGPGSWAGPALFTASAADVLASAQEVLVECFGPASVVVSYTTLDEAVAVVRTLGASLTATIHAEEGEDLGGVVAALTAVAGRLVWNGWPTGLPVGWATHHGGGWPATTDPLHTSVGAHAMRRFLKPVAYQGVPDAMLPPALREANPLSIPRRVDGKLG